VLGLSLGFGGDAVLDLLEPKSAKLTLAVVLYSTLGVVAIGYALTELGVFRFPSLLGRVRGPALPDDRRPYLRAVVLGGTFGAGLGIGCPMPQYYIILGWAVAAANPAYGAALLGSYGLGRVLPALGIGALILAGVERRHISRVLTAFRERTGGATNAVLMALGSYLIVLFGGVVLYRALTL
jgi:cytochrome c biogenesis protein CcdA